MLLVPSGDGVDRRMLVLWQAVGLVAALALVAGAPTFPTFTLACMAVGVGATIAQQVVQLPETDVVRPVGCWHDAC